MEQKSLIPTELAEAQAASASSFSDEQWYDLDENAEEIAAEHGCIVVLPEENQLQIDIDSEEAYIHCLRRLNDAAGKLNCNIKITPSKSGLPHRHITITIKGHVFSEWERLALQYFFGSDSVREDLNVLRKLSGCENPTRLFEPDPELADE